MAAHNRPQRINDPAVHDAARRLDWFTKMVDKRVAEFHAATDRTGRTLAMLEAEAAAKLVEAACYEIALRLVSHRLQTATQVFMDPAREISRRLTRYRDARVELERMDGPIAQA